MSIQAMTALAAKTAHPRRAKTPTPENAASGSAVSSAIAAIAAYIPTEVVAGYVAVTALAASLKLNPWALWWVFIILTPFYTAYAYLQRPAVKAAPADRKKLAVLIGFALVGYVVWTLALPATPFVQFFGDATSAATVGGIVVVIVAPLLAALSTVFKIRDTTA